MTPSELGAILVAVFIAFYTLGIFARATAFLGFVSVVLLGTSGWLGRLLSDITGAVVHVAGIIGGDVLGSASAAVIGVVIYLVIRYGHGLHPKHQASQVHAWFGVTLGALVVTGLTGIPQLNGLHAGIVSAISTLTTAVHG